MQKNHSLGLAGKMGQSKQAAGFWISIGGCGNRFLVQQSTECRRSNSSSGKTKQPAARQSDAFAVFEDVFVVHAYSLVITSSRFRIVLARVVHAASSDLLMEGSMGDSPVNSNFAAALASFP